MASTITAPVIVAVLTVTLVVLIVLVAAWLLLLQRQLRDLAAPHHELKSVDLARYSRNVQLNAIHSFQVHYDLERSVSQTLCGVLFVTLDMLDGQILRACLKQMLRQRARDEQMIYLVTLNSVSHVADVEVSEDGRYLMIGIVDPGQVSLPGTNMAVSGTASACVLNQNHGQGIAMTWVYMV
jgi:hypothetical protein